MRGLTLKNPAFLYYFLGLGIVSCAAFAINNKGKIDGLLAISCFIPFFSMVVETLRDMAKKQNQLLEQKPSNHMDTDAQ